MTTGVPRPVPARAPEGVSWPARLARAANRNGMLVILLLLATYYTLVTVAPQQPGPAEGGRQIAERLASLMPAGASVFLVAGTAPEDQAYLDAVASTLERRRIAIAARVNGEPRDARLALEKLATAGPSLGAIATTADAAGWTVLTKLAERFPAFAQVRVLTPERRSWPTFLTRQNLLNVANQMAVVAILAVGMTVVILTGGIDLSVGSLIALSAVTVTQLIRDYGGATQAGAGAMVACAAGALALGAAVGLGSGVVIAAFRVPPFIATLAVMQVASGLAFMLAQGKSIYEVPDAFTWLGRGTGWLGLPHAVVLMVALYFATHLLMTRTVLGRQIYAVGGNPEAARMCGLPTGRILVFAYAFCGAMAGLGGVVLASQLKSGAPTYGVMYELYAIAAVVVGGTSLSGGRGRIFDTLVGASIIAVIQNGMNLTGVESYQQKVVLGLVILGAVLLDLLKRRDWRRWIRRFARQGDDAGV